MYYVSNIREFVSNDALIVKLDSNGNTEWLRTIGATSLEGLTALSIGADDFIYVAGSSADRSYWVGDSAEMGIDGQIHSGYSDAFVSKYTIDGSHLWTRLIGTPGEDYAYALTTDRDGSVYVVGSTEVDSDANYGLVGEM